MKLVYAHYPSLEDAFIRQVRAERTNPLEPWLVVCASSFLSAQLKTRLAREFGAAANMHFSTASGLLSELDAEPGTEKLPLLPQDNLRDFLIKNLLLEPGLDRYPVSRGFVQAVKSSLRDLSDSLADPDVLDEYLSTSSDAALEQDGGRLEWLSRVYRAYRERENKVPGYRSYQSAFENALEQVEKSDFLKGFSRIIFYGFYDMPGRALELLNRVRACYPVTVFAPYAAHPAYRFAKKFFETNWLGASAGENAEENNFGALGAAGNFVFSPEGTADAPDVQIVSAADLRGEVFFIAKEILRLSEKEGYAFSDMAVIVRSAAPYQDELRRVFKENCIPLDASFTYPLQKFPLGVFCLNLFALAANGFDRETVLAVVSSPYFKHAKKYKWRALIAKSLVSRDLNQWQDLLPQTKNYDPELLAWLEEVSSRLGALDAPRKWADNCALANNFLAGNTDETAFQGKDAEIYAKTQETVAGLSAYSAVREQSQSGEFVRELADALSALSFNETEQVRGGVTFTDAVRGRGLNRRAVFLPGLNDKVFPLVMPEDPVLRDYYRHLLRDVLGYWVNQSLDRGDEEKLLFFTAATAGAERLYALYGRADDAGKAAVPSVYLAELARAARMNVQADDAPRVSGRLSERILSAGAEWLTAKEMSFSIILHPESARADYQEAGLLTDGVSHALNASLELAKSGPLSDFDGLVKSGAGIFESGNKKGFSPSALQEIAQCPLKYFFDKGLNLAEEDEPLSRQELAPNLRGDAYHEVLHHFYQTLYDKKLTHELFDSAALEYLNQSLGALYTPETYKKFGIYPVVWELILEDIRQKLSDFVLADLKDLGSFTPSKFELPVSSEPTDELPFRLRGFMDRVDLDQTAKAFRVVDYKSSKKGTKNLASDLFKYLIFQPFVYVFIGLQVKELKGYQSAGSCLLSINKGYERRDLTPEAFDAVRERACKFLNLLMGLVKDGTFFVCPSDLCEYCPYASICRRDSFKSLLRARKSAAYKSLEEARQ